MTLFQLLALPFALRMLTPTHCSDFPDSSPTALSFAYFRFMAETSIPALGPLHVFVSSARNALFHGGHMGHPLPSCTQMSPSQRCLPWPSLCKILHALCSPLHPLSPLSYFIICLHSSNHHHLADYMLDITVIIFFNFAHKSLPSRIPKKQKTKQNNPHADMSKTLITVFICLKI